MLAELIKEPFLGFQPDALKFLKQLRLPKNNNTAWFAKNRERYEYGLKKPMRDLIDSLAMEIGKIDKSIVVNYRSIFRINKDIRFSKDKSPYKTHMSAAFAFEKVKSWEIAQFYFHIKPEEFMIFGGQYTPENDYLKKFRALIYRDPESFEEIIHNKAFKKAFGELQGESFPKLPKEYTVEEIYSKYESTKEAEELIKLLKMKQIYVEKTYPVEIIFDDRIIDVIMENIKILHPFVKYLDGAMK